MDNRTTLNVTARDLFQSLKKRPPSSTQELKEWLTSDEAKAAMAFETSDTSPSRWGAVGRS